MKQLHDGTMVSLDTPTRSTSRGRKLLTVKEISSREAEEAIELADKPLKDWETAMKASDNPITRGLEAVMDALDAPTRARIDSITLDKYADKKALRASKPV